MTSFFISPYCPPQWEGTAELRILPNHYSQELRSQWPDAEIIGPDDPKNYHLGWILPNGLEGELLEDEQVVVIDGTSAALAEFALWHRSIIPDRYEMYLFHESLYFTLQLTTETKYQEIIDVIG